MNNSLNLQEVNQEQAIHLAKFYIRAQKNLFLFGRRGTGKTEICLQAAQECNFKVNYINLSVIERADLSGYPNINSPGDIVTFKSPSFLPRLTECMDPDHIILFDEVDKAPPEVVAPLLEILQFKTINGTGLNVSSCFLTGNMANEHSYSNSISHALLDRGAKYILSFDFDKWVEWAKEHQVHELIIGFLRNHPEFACGKIDDESYASPSPRGWTLASDALYKAKDLKLSDIQTVAQIISGFVGNEAGMRFKIWYEYYHKFEPVVHQLIEHSVMSIEWEDLAPTEKVVFVIAACHHTKMKVLENHNFDYLDNLVKFLTAFKVDPELQVMGLYNSFSFEMITKHQLYKSTAFFDLFKRIMDTVAIKK